MLAALKLPEISRRVSNDGRGEFLALTPNGPSEPLGRQNKPILRILYAPDYGSSTSDSLNSASNAPCCDGSKLSNNRV
jgi:hypothetical protein